MLARCDENLQPYNTLGLAARAKAVVTVDSNASLREALAWARERGLPVIPLGEGSNVVIAGNLDALVLRMATQGTVIVEEGADRVLLRVSAGENWHRFVSWTLDQGFYGLENLALIPGTVGAAPIQNIGAYGVEIGPMVRRVHGVTVVDGREFVIDGAACAFGYRDSVFKHALQDQVVITEIDLELSRRPAVRADYPALARTLKERGIDEPTPADVFRTVVDIRRSKLPDPAVVPNAGSFFKNPVVAAEKARELARCFPDMPSYPQDDGSIKLPAAWLIDYCGWKGYRGDRLGVHPEHALVLVNLGNDNGDALLSLAAEVARSVADTFDIALSIEPRIYGEAA
ncbi:MAG: UDP-N-acetylmuramate dehydrogenase [Pseudomonadales bacterium]|nr:UDP-N-acetylmuramate dehydrogenase [Pseudomonadales bacterium]